MKRIFFAFFLLLPVLTIFSQSAALAKAFGKFENDPQLKNALSSLYVVQANNGAVIFNKNATIGLAPGSTQKIITSAAAYELLGKDFRYKTEFGLASEDGKNNIYIKPSGDPTLGSSRWESTNEKKVLERLLTVYKPNVTATSKLFIENTGWNYETIPDGWIWQDIGNYFGAGADVLNWRENQFDLFLKSGSVIGTKAEVVETQPKLYFYKIRSEVASAAKGTGDNSFIYFPLNGNTGTIRGTIPVNESRFKVSGSFRDAKQQFAETLLELLIPAKRGDEGSDNVVITASPAKNFKLIHTEISPALDSIIYWLNKKSINLYAEALVKTIGYQKAKTGSTEKGMELIKNFWKTKGIDERELNILDGSGLSPSNRVTTRSLVSVLQYAKKQPWYSGFYNSLPEYNGIKMKSGTIKDVKGFTGYHTSKKGVAYIFAFVVNNYNGATTALVQKMYQVLNELK